MKGNSKGASPSLPEQYYSLLRGYVRAPTESLRGRANQLSHEAIARGLGVLDVAAAYQEALLRVLIEARTPRDVEQVTRRASELLMESLVPFEMTHRGYEESIGRLEERVNERTRELASANAELQSFAYSVAHDLRAPLRHVNAFSQLLLKEYADRLDDRGKGFLQFQSKAAQKMGQLIDDLLKLSRVTRAELHRQPVNLSEIARSVAEKLRREQPNRQLEVTIAPGVVADGDPQLLRTVLANLLDNAWKFTSTRPAAQVEFGVLRQNGKPVYYVKDNGVGFNKAYEGKLFDAFQRLHRADEFPGTGMGLAIVQRIVQRHGGIIWAEGEIDKGATFYFTLT